VIPPKMHQWDIIVTDFLNSSSNNTSGIPAPMFLEQDTFSGHFGNVLACFYIFLPFLFYFTHFYRGGFFQKWPRSARSLERAGNELSEFPEALVCK